MSELLDSLKRGHGANALQFHPPCEYQIAPNKPKNGLPVRSLQRVTRWLLWIKFDADFPRHGCTGGVLRMIGMTKRVAAVKGVQVQTARKRR